MIKSNLSRIITTVSISALVFGCAKDVSHPMYTPSKYLQQYQHESFDEYLKHTEQWVRGNRVYFGHDKQKEHDAILPFELIPDTPNGKGILLVHGLGDSPFSYVDIAPELAEQGFLVRVILLPGHGTKPADLMLPSLEDWQLIVKHHKELLESKVDDVWLGGFSTGANLVTSLAYEDKDIEGLLLFSPAFMPRDSKAKLTPYAKWVSDWAEQTQEYNYTRYISLAMNGAAVYYETSVEVRKDIKDAKLTTPTFMVLSEKDETIDSQFARDAFINQFEHQANLLTWYGEEELDHPQIKTLTMNLPEQHITSGSHISPVSSPSNSVYGVNGEIRICFEEQPMQIDCTSSNDVWYSAFGDGNPEHVRARLAYNPYFDESMKDLASFVNTVE